VYYSIKSFLLVKVYILSEREENMISNTSLKTRITRKTNPSVKTVIATAMKEKSWMPLAQMLSGPTNRYSSLNLSEINTAATESIIVVPGKVLSSGSLDKKVSVYAISFSASAEEKLDKAKIAHGTILDIIKKNPKATGVQVLR
jgi:large subunit ribosomal protein L18e